MWKLPLLIQEGQRVSSIPGEGGNRVLVAVAMSRSIHDIPLSLQNRVYHDPSEQIGVNAKTTRHSAQNPRACPRDKEFDFLLVQPTRLAEADSRPISRHCQI